MIQESITVGAGTEFPLRGMLTLPDGADAPVPAAVFVHGSGASDMDERVGKLTPFRDLAEGLAARGVAALRYDKRTFAHAKKLRKTSPTVWDETIEDALRAVALLKGDARIDPARVFLVGHSEGAMLAPRIDAQGADVRGLILLAGSPYRLEEIVLRQLTMGGGGKGLLKPVVALEKKIFGRKFDGLYEMSEDEAKQKKFAGSVSLYYFQEMGRKTAADYLLESAKPVLIAQGGRDVQVLASDDFARFQTLLAGRERTQFKLYPDLNHCFVPALTDDILKAAKEFSVERHIGADVIGDVADFICAN